MKTYPHAPGDQNHETSKQAAFYFERRGRALRAAAEGEIRNARYYGATALEVSRTLGLPRCTIRLCATEKED